MAMNATLPGWMWLVLCVGSCLVGFGAGMLVVWPYRYPDQSGKMPAELRQAPPPPLPSAGRFPADTGALILWSEEYAKFDRIDAEIASWDADGKVPARWRKPYRR